MQEFTIQRKEEGSPLVISHVFTQPVQNGTPNHSPMQIKLTLDELRELTDNYEKMLLPLIHRLELLERAVAQLQIDFDEHTNVVIQERQ